MRIDAPFRVVGQIIADACFRPRSLSRFIAFYANLRSWSYPAGKLPSVSIFDLVPGAAHQPVRLQNMFEVPVLNVTPERHSKRETASTTLRDAYCLALLARSINAKSFLEIGTSFGETALLFALNSPDDASVTTLDIQTDNPAVGIKFRDTPVASKIRLLLMSSDEFGRTNEGRTYDMIFVDGDHSYAGVLHDSLLAFRFLRPGGMVCWHDYTFRFRYEVVRALDELRSKGYDIRHVMYSNLCFL